MFPRFTGLALILAVPAGVRADWTAISLHPVGARSSKVHAVTPSLQSGYLVPLSGQSQGGVWAGSPGSWSNLSPDPQTSAFVFGMDETTQVGSAVIGAALWHGTPGSYVNLHPPGPAYTSAALAVRGIMQVGGITLLEGGGTGHAALWYGSAASFVDLHPANAIRSGASATDGALQGGYADWFNGSFTVRHAVLWNGSAQSVADLNPPGKTSQVNGMAPGIQVGYAAIPHPHHAAVWRGTAGSYVDLHPAGNIGDSNLFATTGQYHAGFLTQGTWARAAVNFGTPEAWLDLHQFLPPEYDSFSLATSIAQDGNTLYVGGHAWSSLTSNYEAFLWVGTIPAPGTAIPLLAFGALCARRSRNAAPA